MLMPPINKPKVNKSKKSSNNGNKYKESRKTLKTNKTESQNFKKRDINKPKSKTQ